MIRNTNHININKKRKIMSIKILQRYTSRTTISINKYFEEVNKYPILSMEGEVKYAKLALKGDEQAKEMLIKTNLRFVISVAKQYQNRGVSIEDLINEGNIGLIAAAGKFDPTKGFKFISYAVWWIRSYIQTALTDCERKCVIPHSRVGKMNKLRKLISAEQSRLERDILPMDLYDSDEFADHEIDELFSLINGTDTSMDKEIGEDGMTVGDLMSSNSFAQATQLMDDEYNNLLLCTMVNKLETRDMVVVSHLHGINGYDLLNANELSEKLGLTRQRIDQIYKRGLRLMRNMTLKTSQYESI
jgi:RNA polymerase primary sigma factor